MDDALAKGIFGAALGLVLSLGVIVVLGSYII